MKILAMLLAVAALTIPTEQYLKLDRAELVRKNLALAKQINEEQRKQLDMEYNFAVQSLEDTKVEVIKKVGEKDKKYIIVGTEGQWTMQEIKQENKKESKQQ